MLNMLSNRHWDIKQFFYILYLNHNTDKSQHLKICTIILKKNQPLEIEMFVFTLLV